MVIRLQESECHLAFVFSFRVFKGKVDFCLREDLNSWFLIIINELNVNRIKPWPEEITGLGFDFILLKTLHLKEGFYMLVLLILIR